MKIGVVHSIQICNNVLHEIAFEVINFDDKKTTFNFTINNLVIESGSKSEEVEQDSKEHKGYARHSREKKQYF